MLSATGPVVAIARVLVGSVWLIGITLAPAFAHAFVVTPVLCEILIAWSGADRWNWSWKGNLVNFVRVATAAGIQGGRNRHIVLLSSKMGARACGHQVEGLYTSTSTVTVAAGPDK